LAPSVTPLPSSLPPIITEMAIDGDVAGFDSISFRTAFANMIEVSEELVEIQFVGGSVQVTCTTTLNDEGVRARVVREFETLSKEKATAALNVAVLSISVSSPALLPPSSLLPAPPISSPGSRPPPPPSPPPQGALVAFVGAKALSLLEEMSISIAVMAGSFSIVVAIAGWIKFSGANPGFKMILSLDMALAAMDVGSDTLFITTAFNLEGGGDDADGASLDPASGTARPLAWASLIFLVVAGTISFLCCLKLVHYFFRRRSTNAADIDWENFDSHSNLFGILAVLSSADIELIKLFPWRTKIYDGFPHMWVAMLVMGITLLEDVPQLICQITFVATVESSSFAWVSIGITLLSIAWRVAKRSFKLMGAGAVAAVGDARRDEGGATADEGITADAALKEDGLFA
jgi:hypothetical protein